MVRPFLLLTAHKVFYRPSRTTISLKNEFQSQLIFGIIYENNGNTYKLACTITILRDQEIVKKRI